MSLTKIFDINPNLRRSLVEAVSGETLDLTRSGTVWHFNPQNVLTEYAADVPAFGANGLWSVGAYRQECLNSEDPGEWNTVGAPTVTDTGETLSNFKKHTVTDDGAAWNRISLYDTDISHNPTVRTFFAIYYDAGTSNKIRFVVQDLDGGLTTDYQGDIGSATVDETDAGAITILSDGPDDYYNCRSVCGYIDWINPSNRLILGIGPYSDDNSNIIIYGADIFNDTTVRLPHVPSSGSTVSIATQAADGAGNGLSPALSGLDSRVEAAMDSTFSALFHLIPEFASTDIDGNGILEWSTGDSVWIYPNITESPTGTFTVTSGGTATDNSVAFDISLLPRYTPVDITFNCTVGGNFLIYDGDTYQDMGIIDTGVQTFRGAISQYDTAIIRLCTSTMSIEDVTITSALPLLSTGDFKFAIDGTELVITDGTNTATVAHGGFSAGDELWLFGQANASTSKLRAGIIGDSSITWGTETAYTGGMNPGTNLLVFEDNEEYAQIGGAWIYEGVAGSDGEMVEARDAVRDNNPRVAAVGVREVGVRPMMVNIM